MNALALLCLLAALVLGARGMRSSSTRPSSSRGRDALARVAALYDGSPMGKRLAARLWRAQIRMSPIGWRCGQLLIMVPVATLLMAAGTAVMGAWLTAASVVRGGGSLILRLRRGACRDALDVAGPVLARALATELAAWGGGPQAVIGASSRGSRSGTSPMAAWILERAAARVVLGGDASISLRRAIDDALPTLPGTSPAAQVAAVFALHRSDATATATALDRLAVALEEDAEVHRQARGAAGEVRMSAVAVPCLAAVTLAMLLTADPAALAAALSMPLLPALGAAAVAVVVAAAGVHRLVST
jgi:hypothetical protein